jgi:signal transduction histidine kinase
VLARLDRPRPESIDWLVALAVAGLSALQLGLDPRCCGSGLTGPGVRFALALAQTLPVAWRRRLPPQVLAVTGSAAVAIMLIGGPSSDLGLLGVLLAYYSVAAAASRRFAVGLGVLSAFGLAALAVITSPSAVDSVAVVRVSAAFATVWLLADRAWRRRQDVRLMEDRAARTEREHQQRAREAAETERARIWRDVHDVVADGLSVIMIQAGAARSVADRMPENVDACLRAIDLVSHETWTELRHLLDLGRQGRGPAGQPAPPGLAHLERLVRRFEAAGLAVDLAVLGAAGPVPPEVDHSAYRIVEEGLTNALRHSGAGRARVTIRREAGCLHVEVANDRAGPAPRAAAASHTAGHGLVGMRERVEQLGGALSVRSGDVFVVSASLPVPIARW